MKHSIQLSSTSTDAILKTLSQTTGKIHSIRLYLKNIDALKRFSCTTWNSRQHVIAAISSGSHTGYAECILSVNQPHADLSPWKDNVSVFLGMPVGQAVIENRRYQGIWPEQLVEMLEMALIDLCGKCLQQPACRLLGLAGNSSICGVHVILSDDLEEVSKSTQWAKLAGKHAYIKVKLFGDPELDCNIIQTVRRYCSPEETYLIGDVNCGYGPEGTQICLDQIAQKLSLLKSAGLDACEDPAHLTPDQWVTLQSQLKTLALIPDEPLRCARTSIHKICSGMGRIYNIHPDSAGSILDAIALAARIGQLHSNIMIGDDSLVGPSASIWQQLAVGLGARWVEATEKANESDFYYACVEDLATDSTHNPISVTWKAGFGITLNEARLKEVSDRWVEVKQYA